MNDKISSILAAFETFDGIYRRDEVDAALTLQDEITPYLIDVLENVLADPEATLDKPDYFGHIYAIQLLGYFREVRAHDVVVDLASLPPEIPHDLFGDIITEDLAAILLATCGGSIARIKALLLNREADEYCRSAAARALVCDRRGHCAARGDPGLVWLVVHRQRSCFRFWVLGSGGGQRLRPVS